MNDLELGWLIGIIDGEGCLTIRHHTYDTKKFGKRTSFYPQLVVANTDKELVERCQRISGLGTIFDRERKQPSKKQYHWMIHSGGLRELIPLMKEHSTKKRQFEILERVLEIISVSNGMENYWGGQARTVEELNELLQLREELIDLHGLPARKLAKEITLKDVVGSAPINNVLSELGGIEIR
jgi:hypothetical protein